MKYLAPILTLIVFAVIPVEAVAPHPSVGHNTNQIHGYPDQAPASWSYGELTFLGPDKFPAVEDLTDVERYMLAGTATSPFSSKAGLPSWHMSVWAAVHRIYNETGAVPDRLTPEVLRASPAYSSLSDAGLDVFRNPITGEWPRLNAKQFSPGDVYMHPLTQDEMRHYAGLTPSYRLQWFEGKGLDREKLSRGGNVDEMYTADYTLEGPVWFVRIYGEKGVILNTITYVGH
ncbi:MAG: hypothetical protein M3R04_08340 [bacterium]|nr:hypothetical protein [bacterium]